MHGTTSCSPFHGGDDGVVHYPAISSAKEVPARCGDFSEEMTYDSSNALPSLYSLCSLRGGPIFE